MGASSHNYRGRVAIVTGGASGIGAALGEKLARRGTSVVLADRDARVEQVVERLTATGATARPIVVDVTDAARVDELVRTTVLELGRLDFMFNNAGLGCFGDAREFSPEQWREIVDVNFWGCVHGSLAAYRWMAGHGGGQIVNTASLAGVVPVPGAAPYAAAKHAVVGFTLSLRAEAADLGVRVNVVCPGPVRSHFHSAMLRPESDPTQRGTPAAAIDSVEAARAILDGAAHDEAVIVFPSLARRTWRKWRWWPSLLTKAHRDIVAALRR